MTLRDVMLRQARAMAAPAPLTGVTAMVVTLYVKTAWAARWRDTDDGRRRRYGHADNRLREYAERQAVGDRNIGRDARSAASDYHERQPHKRQKTYVAARVIKQAAGAREEIIIIDWRLFNRISLSSSSLGFLSHITGHILINYTHIIFSSYQLLAYFPSYFHFPSY